MSVSRLVRHAMAFLAVFALTGEAAAATEWFVAPGGTGTGSSNSPAGRIQDALNAAMPGDTVTVRPGLYEESIRTVRHGTRDAPIRLRAASPRGSVILSVPGRVLTVSHAHFVAGGLVLDGQYGESDTVRVDTGADDLVLRDLEIRRSARDLVDLASPRRVLIESCLIHHALNAANGRTDAHGIAAGAVRDLTIRDTEIHTFSGDGLQLDPDRSVPGWTGVTLDGVRIWLAPLRTPENGFAAGTVPGENAVDTKAADGAARARLAVRNVTAWGFRGGLIGNMAAFNLKENVDVTIDRVTVYDSEIAFRLRGGTASRAAGAWALITNTLVHSTGVAFRYEDAIENLRIWNGTIGDGVARAFHAANAPAARPDVRNLLVLGSRPAEATHGSNLAGGAELFVDAAAGDYRLRQGSPAIDAGAGLPGVTHDRRGAGRPYGAAHDVGAYEWQPAGDGLD